MQRDRLLDGPLGGYQIPLFGGQPGLRGCNGCTDCCNLPEISVTDEEATLLATIADTVEMPAGEPQFALDPDRSGWQLMQGPCAFRDMNSTDLPGGCRIYEVRPGSCRVFTCEFLLELGRRGQ